MPTISMFYGIIIAMRFDDHNPPHIHAFYQGNEASFNFDGEQINGKFPKKQARLVSAWCIIHQDELMKNWELAVVDKPVSQIKPLE